MAKLVHSYHDRKNPFFTVKVKYDFAVDGGAQGAINLGGSIPSGATVLGGFARVVTPPTSGGAGTLALHVNAADDLVAAAAVSGAPWSTAGNKSIVPVFTGATAIRLTADRNITATIGTADLTAGVVECTLFCVRG